jgi:hypothetical protein
VCKANFYRLPATMTPRVSGPKDRCRIMSGEKSRCMSLNTHRSSHLSRSPTISNNPSQKKPDRSLYRPRFTSKIRSHIRQRP